MGYALFAQRKVVLDGLLNTYQLQQAQRSDEQNQIANHTLGLQQQMSNMQAAQSQQLTSLYNSLAAATNETTRARINAQISALESSFDAELQTINNQIYQSSIKENTIEMDVKNLDTKVTETEKQLEAIEDAESKGIENSVPKFNGIG